MGPGACVEDLTWIEVQKRLADGAVAVLPVGAGAKEHGLHLPMSTDRIQAEWFGRRLAETENVLVWPTLTYGYYPAFVHFAGSCSLATTTFRQIVGELLDALARFGAERILVLNTGLSTIQPIEDAVADCQAPDRVRLVNIYRGPHYCSELAAVTEQAQGSHADEAETSVMMAIAPTQVEPGKSVAWDRLAKVPGPFQHRDPEAPNYTPSGVYGDPTLATPEKGARLVAAILQDLSDALRLTYP